MTVHSIFSLFRSLEAPNSFCNNLSVEYCSSALSRHIRQNVSYLFCFSGICSFIQNSSTNVVKNHNSLATSRTCILLLGSLMVWLSIPVPSLNYNRLGVLSSASLPLKVRWSWQCFIQSWQKTDSGGSNFLPLEFIKQRFSWMFENSLGILLSQRTHWFLLSRVTWLQGVQFGIFHTSTTELSQMFGVFSPRKKV